MDPRVILATAVGQQRFFRPDVSWILDEGNGPALAEMYSHIALQVYPTQVDRTAPILVALKARYPDLSHAQIARICHTTVQVVRSWLRPRGYGKATLSGTLAAALWNYIHSTYHDDLEDDEFLVYRSQFIQEALQNPRT